MTWPRTLLWRTVLLLAGLLAVAQVATFLAFGIAERGPRAQQVGRHVASLVQLTRAALVHSQGEARVALLAELARREGIQVYPADSAVAPPAGRRPRLAALLREALERELGAPAEIRLSATPQPTLWTRFSIGEDAFWLAVPRARVERPFRWAWLGWAAGLLALAFAGAFLIARRVTRPLRALGAAAAAVGRGGIAQPIAADGPAEVRQLIDSFNRMSSELARAGTDRALMLAGISHDLRTPLARLRLAVEMLPDAAMREGMTQDIEDMDAILGQFIAFSREAAAEALEEVDLNVLVTQVLERYQRVGRGVSFVPSSLPASRVRPLAIQRLLSNLIDNALRHGADAQGKASVEVRTERKGERVVLRVLDRGPGIPESEAARLKKPFTRLDGSRSTPGSGLGLAIVERIARMHGGSLWLLPRDGGGLEARVELPVG